MFFKVYAFNDAPEHLRELSEHGGDEDWLLLADLTDDPNQDEEIMAKFNFLIMSIDHYDFGGNTIHYTRYEGKNHAVYIIAHA